MRILLIRTSALGDIVHCLPALRALRQRFPAATIGWVVERQFAPLLARDPDLDALLEVKLRGWRKSPLSPRTWRQLRTAVGAIRGFAADVVIDLMGNHKAGALAALSSCKRRIGLRRAHRPEPSSAIWLSEFVEPQGRHSVERALSLVGHLEADTRSVDFGADKILLAGLASNRAAVGEPYAVIHPGAAWPDKRYPAERWGEVAQQIRRQVGWTSLISVGPGEEELGRAVLEAGGGSARLAEAPSLPALVALLGNAKLVLAGDTGPLHLAHALGTPVLALMGPTDPETNGPYGAPERVLYKRQPGRSRQRREAQSQVCRIDIPPQAVFEKAMDIVELGARPSNRAGE